MTSFANLKLDAGAPTGLLPREGDTCASLPARNCTGHPRVALLD